MVPRGSTLIAGGTAQPTDTEFTIVANLGDRTYGILSNKYLDEHARTTKYTATITVHGDTFSYDECTTYTHSKGGEVAHTDRNLLRRVT
jgi:hypothetical protein